MEERDPELLGGVEEEEGRGEETGPEAEVELGEAIGKELAPSICC